MNTARDIYIQNIQYIQSSSDSRPNGEYIEHFEHVSVSAVNIADRLQQLERLGYSFSLAADGTMSVKLPTDANADDSARWLEPLRGHRETVRAILGHRAAWLATFDGYRPDGDLNKWASDLADQGVAGALECHWPGGWPGWRDWYREKLTD